MANEEAIANAVVKGLVAKVPGWVWGALIGALGLGGGGWAMSGKTVEPSPAQATEEYVRTTVQTHVATEETERKRETDRLEKKIEAVGEDVKEILRTMPRRR